MTFSVRLKSTSRSDLTMDVVGFQEKLGSHPPTYMLSHSKRQSI